MNVGPWGERLTRNLVDQNLHLSQDMLQLILGDKTLGRVRLRTKKYHFHLGHHNENSFVGKPKDLAFHVWYVNHIGFL